MRRITTRLSLIGAGLLLWGLSGPAAAQTLSQIVDAVKMVHEQNRALGQVVQQLIEEQQSGASAKEHAQQLVVTQVETSFDNGDATLMIHGRNFDNGVSPEVTLGGVAMTVDTATDVLIMTVPQTVAPGDYLLVVSTGQATVQHDSYAMTVGAPPQSCAPGTVAVGIDENGNLICEVPLEQACDPGTVVVGVDANGDLICEVPLQQECPPGTVVTGVDENGDLICTSLEQACPPDEFVSGIDANAPRTAPTVWITTTTVWSIAPIRSALRMRLAAGRASRSVTTVWTTTATTLWIATIRTASLMSSVLVSAAGSSS